MGNMIFIGGIHGVGKTYLCQKLKETYNLNSYSASSLISNLKKEQFTINKNIESIHQNQELLVKAARKLKEEKPYLLDGHFCLLNKDGEITRIPSTTFENLAPQSIIVIINSIEQIAKHLINRDQHQYDFEFLKDFQNQEINYASEIAKLLNIPILIHPASNELSELITFINLST